MKILHISNIETQSNGIYSVLSVLVKEQRALGNSVQIININKKSELTSTLFTNIRSFSKFKDYIFNYNPNIVIFHSVYSILYILFAILLRIKKIPYLIELHGALSQENYKKNFAKKYIANILFFNNFIKRAKSIIYLNQIEYKNSIVKNINSSTIFIPNGCYIPLQINKNKLIKSKLSILYMGRIDKHHKGLDILLDAIKILLYKGKINNFYLSLYGTGFEKDINWLLESIKTLPSDVISYKGPVYGKEKDLVFKESNLFILTSRYEGMPMGVLEALSYGLPCILTPGTNFADEVDKQKAGWKVELSAKRIAETIEFALNDYNLNNKILVSNAIDLAKQYAWEKISNESICEYRKVLDGM